MSISSLKQAFEVLESTNNHTPFEAIDYLYEHEQSPKIEEKICFYLKNAFDRRQLKQASYAPLWYAIVAENHLSTKLIDPIISIYTIENNQADFLNEQCSFVLGRLSEKYPDVTASKIIITLQKSISRESNAPYIYLLDGLYIKDIQKYKKELLAILQSPSNVYRIPLARQIANYGFKEALPIIKKMLQEEKKKDSFFSMTADLKVAIKILETKKTKYSPGRYAYHKSRADWKVHYQDFDRYFKKR